MYPVAFQPFLYLHLPPTGENTRQLNYRTSIRTTCNGVVYGNIAPPYKNCRFANCRCVEPGHKKGHISAVVQAIDSKFATKVHRTMHKRNTVLTLKKCLPTFGTFLRGRSHILYIVYTWALARL